ncbi:MAG: hypothetical protein FWD73_07420 [Polyangiaceae bacterium]|nr:hypothetical protein [Polyangiaceae bacterium]
MKKARLRYIFAMGACASIVVACVDLFHSTDFRTLCDSDPNNAACQGNQDDGGRDGQTDSGGDSGDQPLDFCAWSSAEAHDEAVRICAWFGACEGPAGESAFGNCVMHAQFALDCDANPNFRPTGSAELLWQCLTKAKTCDDFNTCTFPKGVPACQFTGGSSGYSGCTTNSGIAVVSTCVQVNDPPIGVDLCSMANKTCQADQSQYVGCTGNLGLMCTPPSSSQPASNCSGSWAQSCVSGPPAIDQGIDCSGFGASKCSSSGGNGAACVPSGGDSCSGAVSSQPTCSGDQVSACVDGQHYTIDCTKFGLTCSPVAAAKATSLYDPFAACVASGTACAGDDTCNGYAIMSCSHGAAVGISCADLHLGPCRLTTVAAKTYAACTIP